MLAENLKTIRKKKNYSKVEMAKVLGIPYTTYNNYEIGDREPNLEKLKEIAGKLGVSLYELIDTDMSKQGEQPSPGTNPLPPRIQLINSFLEIGKRKIVSNDEGRLFLQDGKTKVELKKEDIDELYSGIIAQVELLTERMFFRYLNMFD